MLNLLEFGEFVRIFWVIVDSQDMRLPVEALF